MLSFKYLSLSALEEELLDEAEELEDEPLVLVPEVLLPCEQELAEVPLPSEALVLEFVPLAEEPLELPVVPASSEVGASGAGVGSPIRGIKFLSIEEIIV